MTSQAHTTHQGLSRGPMLHKAPAHISPLFCGILALVMSLAIAWITPEQAQAQPKEPLRMSLVNVASSGGDQPKRVIENILKENKSIALIDSGVVRSAMDNFAVNEKILRKGELREKFQERISRMMQAENIEGLLIIDVFSKGRKLQVVVLGPEGQELKDIKRNIRGGKIEQDTGLDVLKDVFPALGPTVLDYRERVQAATPDPDPDPDPNPDPDPDPNPDAIISEEKTKPKPPPGTFSKGGSVAAGVFLGQRSMEVTEVETTPPDAIKHRTPLVGIGVHVDAVALPIGETKDSALTISGFFNYAPFKTEFKTQGGDGSTSSETFTSNFVSVGGALHYRRFFTASTIGGIYGGGEYISLRIASNPNYTGNIYGVGRAGAELGISFAPESYVIVHGGLLPVFKADNSAGALGESPTSLGYEAGGTVLFRLTDKVFARLGYKFELVSPTFPEPGDTSKIDNAAESRDILHTGGLQIGFTI